MKSKILPFVILLLAFVLRVALLAARPIWYDEAFSVFLAERDFASIVRGTAVDVQPPLYYFLLRVWLQLGENVFVLRFLSVALSMLVVALVYVVARRWFSERVSAFATFFAALAPFQIYHAQELRMYTLFAFGALLYVYGVSQPVAPRWRRFVLIALGTLIALYAHSLALLTLVAANVYLLFKRAWRAQIELLAAQAVALIAFAPWLLFLPGQIGGIQRAYWTQPPGLLDILQMLMVFTTYLPLPMPVLAFALFITLALAALAALQVWRAPRGLGLVLAFALVPPALVFALSYLIRSVFVPRGVIASALAYYVLLAGLAARPPRVGQGVIAAIAFVVAVSVLPFYYAAWGEWRRAPFAEADQFLRAQMQSNDLVLHDNKLSFFPMHFYDRALPQEFLADPPGSSNDTLAPGSQEAMNLFPIEFGAATRGRARVWFVIFQTAMDEAAQAGHAHGNLSRLDTVMRRGDVSAFGDLRIYRYENR